MSVERKMKKIWIKLVISTVLMAYSQGGNAAQETVVKTEIGTQGNAKTTVEYKDKTSDFQIDTFEQADVNNDGCVDKTEALDKGILKFEQISKVKQGCLNAAEYNKAMRIQ